MMVKRSLRKSFSCCNVKTRLSKVKNFSSSPVIAWSFFQKQRIITFFTDLFAIMEIDTRFAFGHLWWKIASCSLQLVSVTSRNQVLNPSMSATISGFDRSCLEFVGLTSLIDIPLLRS